MNNEMYTPRIRVRVMSCISGLLYLASRALLWTPTVLSRM